MIKIENVEVVGWEHAIRGMRNPMNSWAKSDSYWQFDDPDYTPGFKEYDQYIIGPNDLKLMKKLAKAGTDHRKFMRFIDVYFDVTAPLYWWKEFDTYRAGVAPGGPYPDPMEIDMDSCSTMHKIHAKPFELEDFSCEHLDTEISIIPSDNDLFPILTTRQYLLYTIAVLNKWRDRYLETKDKHAWWQLIQLLPSSYNQRRTVKLNYEVLANMYKSRKNHKLDEWRETFCDWIRTLPYSELITGEE